MLDILIPSKEFWDESKQEFVIIKEQTLTLEHSLIALSKWEAQWHKPFLTRDIKSIDETIDYVRCMTLNKNINQLVYYAMTDKNIKDVNAYIDDSMTATWFSEKKDGKGKLNGEQVTSELIYYWMVALNIPFECEKWHLNRLMTLIKVCNLKNSPDKKMSKEETARTYAELNAARRKQWNSRG